MITEACKLYSRVFCTFKLNVIKIDLFNFELYNMSVLVSFLVSIRTYFHLIRDSDRLQKRLCNSCE